MSLFRYFPGAIITIAGVIPRGWVKPDGEGLVGEECN